MLLVASLVVAGPGNAAMAQGSSPPGPIEHVVVLVLQNGTFDNVFGTYPGADGLGIGMHLLQDSAGRLRSPQRLSPADLGPNGVFAAPAGVEPISNGHTEALTARNGGQMDYFLRAQAWRGLNEDLVLRYYDRTSLPAMWGLADEFVIFDRYFSSYPGDSLPNILHLIAGSNYGIDRGSKETLRWLWQSRFPTIFDRATAAGVSWKYYVGGLRQLDQAKLVNGGYFDEESRPSQLYWAPVLSIARFWRDGGRLAKIQDQEQFFVDVATDNLPAISFVLPVPNTHWPTSPQQSQARLLSFVNAVKKSPAWPRTAIFMVTDDWGGFYDHVPPPRLKGHLLGFRVPVLLVSPLVKKGFVSHALLDHSAIPDFIAETFELTPVANPHTQARFDDVWGDEIRGGNTILSLGQSRAPEAFGKDRASSVFVLYVVGLALAIFLLVATARGRRVRPEPGVVPAIVRLSFLGPDSVADPRPISGTARTSHWNDDSLMPGLDLALWTPGGGDARPPGRGVHPGSGSPYPPELLGEAIKLYRSSGRSIREVAKNYGISSESLRRLTRREIAVVHDTFTREVVDWAIVSHLGREFVLEAVETAIHNRRPNPGLVHHPAQVTYTSLAFGRWLAEAGIRPLKRSVGAAYDNAVMESFLATLKTELLHRTSWPTRQDAELGIIDYIRALLQPASSPVDASPNRSPRSPREGMLVRSVPADVSTRAGQPHSDPRQKEAGK